MPQTFYTEDEVQMYTRMLARAYGMIADGPATEIARQSFLREIQAVMGWRQPPGDDE